MKKSIFIGLLGILSIVFSGCYRNEPEPYKPYEPVEEKTPTASFSYKTAHPLKAVFNNTSDNAESYKWDFGDGTTSTEKSPTHRYASKGVYSVQLTVINGSKKDFFTNKVQVEDPTKCYFAGVTYVKLSVNNEYVRFKLFDDDFFRDVWVTSEWKLLSTANLPFQYTLKEPLLLDYQNGIDYFTLELYYNKSTSGNGSKIDAVRITSSTLNTYPEELATSDKTNPNQIKIQFIWK